jgi:hypothetical protein
LIRSIRPPIACGLYDPGRRFVLSKLRDLWIAIGNERSLMTDDELTNDIERLRRVQSELTGVC